MIINPTEYNEKGLSCIKLVILGMKDIRVNVVQVSCDQSGGEGGVSQKLTFAHRGGGGVWRGAKSAHVILEQPLNPTVAGPPAITMQGGGEGQNMARPPQPP